MRTKAVLYGGRDILDRIGAHGTIASMLVVRFLEPVYLMNPFGL
jgi:hypothetical protein